MSTKSVLICLALAAFVLFGWRIARSGAYESAEYKVVEKEGSFEIREYPDLMMAATKMKSENRRDNGSFMRLFRYISGENDNSQKVAMTTPVFMESEPENEGGQMGFVIPKEVAEKQVPEPKNDRVTIEKREGGRYAVIRFNGRMNRESVANSEKSLREWMSSKKLKGEAKYESAGYDPPWTPGRFRRNEVLVRLQLPAPKKPSQNEEKQKATEVEVPTQSP